MTRTTNARLAGVMFLLYIAMGLTAMALSSPVGSAQGIAAKLAAIAAHAPRVRLAILLKQLLLVDALALAVALGLLWVATTPAPDAAAANALGALLLKGEGWSTLIAAFPFAVGSTLYAWLFLRARSIPMPLAWLGVIASILLVVLLPAQLVGFVKGPVTAFMWLPMLVFEVALALWLLIKGVGPVGETT